jgi:hypothetical protein
MRVSTRLLSLFGIHFSFPFLIASRFLALMDGRIEPQSSHAQPVEKHWRTLRELRVHV